MRGFGSSFTPLFSDFSHRLRKHFRLDLSLLCLSSLLRRHSLYRPRRFSEDRAQEVGLSHEARRPHDGGTGSALAAHLFDDAASNYGLL